MMGGNDPRDLEWSRDSKGTKMKDAHVPRQEPGVGKESVRGMITFQTGGPSSNHFQFLPCLSPCRPLHG